MTEVNRIDLQAFVEANRDRIESSILLGEAAIAGGEPFVTLDEALAEAAANQTATDTTEQQ